MTLQSKGVTLQSEARVSAVKSRAHAWMRWQSPPFGGEAAAEWLEAVNTCMQNAPRNNGVTRTYRYRYQVGTSEVLVHSVLQRFLVVDGGAPRDPQGIEPAVTGRNCSARAAAICKLEHLEPAVAHGGHLV